MREIKFRALKDDMSNCNFVYGELVYDAIGVPRITHKDFSGKGLQFNTCIRGTEGQYTGLKDCNGVEIYEGDIIETPTSKLMVIGWSIKFASFVIKRDGWAFSHYFGEALNPEECIVIGNIHQNKELIK